MKEENEEGGNSDSYQSTPGPNERNKRPPLEFSSVQDLIDEGGEDPDWVWEKYLARGWLTDLVGPAKYSGKTTMTCGLSRSIGDGVPFVGFPTRNTRVVYLTEQANSIVEALKLAGLDKRNDFLRILQWRKTRAYSWQEIVDAAVEEARRIDAGLLIVDTVNRFAGLKGDEENSSGAVAAAMNPLLEAAQTHNLAVLSIRHANKEGRARGSTQFDHDVDMLLTLNRVEGNGRENERLLTAVGRYADTPEKLTIEVTDQGYVSRGCGLATQFTRAINGIKDLAPRDKEQPIKVSDLVELLKTDCGVSDATARRAIESMDDSGELKIIDLRGRGNPKGCYLTPGTTVEMPDQERLHIPGDEAA